MTPRPKVMVIGGGFGGCAVVKALANLPVDITLVDKKNHHVFQPLLYQVATASLSPGEIAYPLRAIFRGQENVTVLLGNVDRIDTQNKTVYLKRSLRTFEYDYLIVATGTRHAYFGHPDWEKYAWGLKTLRDALRIRERMLYAFEKAERTRSLEKRRRYLSFVIVGGGPTGVEMAGAIAEMAHNTLVSEFQNFSTKDTKLVLIEGVDRVLGRYPNDLSEKAKTYLEKLGVEVRLNAVITQVDEKGVYIGDELIETENIIWAAGNEASSLVASITEHTTRTRQAKVNSDYSIVEDRAIFCIGDCAYLEDAAGHLVPGVAQGAIQSGRFVAEQIRRDLNGQPRTMFRYFDKGNMATIGKSKAVADIGGIHFSGFFAWFLWSFIHVLFLVNFKSKVTVLMEWVMSYLTNKRSVRLIVSYRDPDHQPKAPQ